MSDIENLRIHFYGVQGSGSVFPARAERAETQQHADLNLLQQVFEDLADKTDKDGRLTRSLEEILGGPVNRKTLSAYRDRFDIEEQRVYKDLVD